MSEPKLTPRERQVYDVLTDVPLTSGMIARLAGIRTTSPQETAAHFCIRLVAKGLAEKGGTGMFPTWRRLSSQGGGLSR